MVPGEGKSMPSGHPGDVHSGDVIAPAARYGAAAVVVIALAIVGWRLALAPVHGVADAASCERAFAEARTRADSVWAGFLSFPDPARRAVNRRCRELRPAMVVDLGR